VDVLDARVAELRVAQARHRVVFVQALLRLGGGLDVPLEQFGMPSALATSSASMVLPVPGSPLISSGRCSVMAALTASLRSSVET
jgi:hypothetical protein